MFSLRAKLLKLLCVDVGLDFFGSDLFILSTSPLSFPLLAGRGVFFVSADLFSLSCCGQVPSRRKHHKYTCSTCRVSLCSDASKPSNSSEDAAVFFPSDGRLTVWQPARVILTQCVVSWFQRLRIQIILEKNDVSHLKPHRFPAVSL